GSCGVAPEAAFLVLGPQNGPSSLGASSVDSEANGGQCGQSVARVTKNKRDHVQSPVSNDNSVASERTFYCRRADSHVVCCMTPAAGTRAHVIRREAKVAMARAAKPAHRQIPAATD